MVRAEETLSVVQSGNAGAARRSFEALCVGETMAMVTPTPGGRLDAASSFVLRAGGAESNVAMYLAQLGHAIAWLGRVGDDPLGRLVLGEVEAAGVDVSLVEVCAGEPTGVYFKDPQPHGTTVHYYRRDSAASAMGPDLLGRLPGVGAGLLHTSGVTAALSESCRRLVRHLLLDRPLGPDTIASFDVNHRPALWAPGAAADELLVLARAADVVFVGLDEAEALWGTPTAEDVRALLHQPSTLVVKDGAVETISFHGDAVERVPALRVEVVDPVGAGDAFAAGWLSGMLGGREHRDRLRLGHLVAGAALRSTGDHAALPPPETLQAALALDESAWARGSEPALRPGS
jgi:2-dehydro-3-deoxygluconokinase